MELGQRIRQARLEAGLSQRQLCGDVITRNMLSQIENGAARPSMDTLTFLAARLGKSISYFLEENTVTSPNQAVMARARQAFGAGNFDSALSALKEYRGPDPVFDWEQQLLTALACMALAEKALAENRVPYAAALLEQAEASGASTPYFGREHRHAFLLLMARVRPESAPRLAEEVNVDDALLLMAEAAADPRRRGALLDAAKDQTSPRWSLLRGKAALALGGYAHAAQLLHRAEEAFPDQTAPLLEQCYRELGDYKMAYAYACKQKP